MNILIFSCFEHYTVKHKLENEFLVKNLSLFNLFDYNVTVLDRTKKYDFYDSFNEIIDKGVKCVKTVDDINVDDYDYFYTFGNFINFEVNKIKGKELTTYVDYFDDGLHKDCFLKYEEMNKFIIENNINVFQFMSDPLDFVYRNSILLTPDTKEKQYWKPTLEFHNNRIHFFPLYQYSHHCVSCMVEEPEKDIKFICGNTIFNEDRELEFNKYLLNIFEKEMNNDEFKFLINGYKNYKYSIDTFVKHEEFFDLCSRSIFGLVLKTYSDSIISANKFHTFLSKNVVPILVKDCDNDSCYIPKHLKDKITVKDGLDLYKFINNINHKDILTELKEHFNDFFNTNYYKGVLRLENYTIKEEQ